MSSRPPRRGGAPGARGTALEILDRVERTQAYANLLLDARLRTGGLSAPDRALATQLVYGVLRWRGKLDWILQPALDRPLAAVEPLVRHLLRLGVFQLTCLDRIPAFAAVDQTVALAKTVGCGRSAPFLNAVLRTVSRRGPLPEPSPTADPLAYWTGPGSHPAWLAARWIARLGPEEAGALMAANNQVPPLTVLVNPLAIDEAAFRQALEAARGEVHPGRFVPGAFSLVGGGPAAELPGFAQGHCLPMDEAGALPVLALELSPGQRVLDACAGGGGKSALLAAAVGPTGEVVAVDVSPRAQSRLAEAAARLRLTALRPELADARTLGARFPAAFPRVLLDAPCTGLGTLRRRPEIKWRRRPEDIPRAAARQAELLAAVAGAVAPGGLLVYSTCSLEPEETDQVVAGFLARHPEFALAELPPAGPEAVSARLAAFGSGGILRSWPHRHGTDGFFIARLHRTC